MIYKTFFQILCAAVISFLPLLAAKVFRKVGEGLTSFPLLDHDTTVVQISNNLINFTKPSDFSGLTLVTELTMDQNLLTEFPDLGDMAVNLTYLKLRGNQISSVNASAVDKLKKLERLFLHWNSLTTFPDPSGPGSTLWIIDLSHNPLVSIPVINHVGHSLTILKLTKNQLTSVDHKAIKNLTSLQIFSSKYNEITTFPNLSFCADALHTIRLWENKITYIPNELLRPLKKLESLQMQGNKISVFPDIRLVSSTLTFFNFEQNDISTIPGEFLVLGNITGNLAFDLRNNPRLFSVPPVQVEGRYDMTFDLRDCPVMCDHNMQWILNHPSLTQKELIVCGEPQVLKGESVLTASLSSGEHI